MTQPHDAAAPKPAFQNLTSLSQGDCGYLLNADLRPDEQEFLAALGFAPHSTFRVCQAGDPWIVQVRGTRIGLSEQIAKNLLVVCSDT